MAGKMKTLTGRRMSLEEPVELWCRMEPERQMSAAAGGGDDGCPDPRSRRGVREPRDRADGGS